MRLKMPGTVRRRFSFARQNGALLNGVVEVAIDVRDAALEPTPVGPCAARLSDDA
jgi:hypothetical protein